MADQDELAERITALQGEIEQLRRAVVSHAVVDQAIGVLMAVGGLRAERSWEVLKDVSQRTNVKLRVVAEHIVRWVDRGELPDDVRAALRAALGEAFREQRGTPLVRRPFPPRADAVGGGALGEHGP
ncbi:ANTAR domain-containing protein [Streptomyces sp. NPDC093094]|uniref:ANTAR domain-containing protein n=1 Tax=Streptomyces sp. NPDC093094 TaxID=3366026 RepID=UPI0037F61AB5